MNWVRGIAFVVIFFLASVGVVAIHLGCTEQFRARAYGGSANVNLPCDIKLVNVTWKVSDLWYLTRPMHKDDRAETYRFKESSSWGVMEGEVIIKECKTEGQK